MAKPTMLEPSATASGPGRTSDGSVAAITSRGSVLDLAAWIRSPHRDRPAVVVTATRVGVTAIDAAALAKGRSGQVEVYLLAGQAPLVSELNAHLPESWRVFGDAARVYPPGGRTDPPPPVTSAAAEADAFIRRQVDNALSRPSSKQAPRESLDSDPWPASATPHHISTVEQAQRLAEHLRHPRRRRPFVVISTHPNSPGPYFNPEDILDEVQGLVPVVVVDAEATYGITNVLGDRTLSVFYGAARVYPVGTAWLTDMYAAPLHMCTSKAQGQRVLPRVVADALSAAHSAGLLTPPAATQRSNRVTGKVAGFSSDHHVVIEYGHRLKAMLHVGRLRLDIPPMRLLRNGQQLSGVVQGSGVFGEFIPDPVEFDIANVVRNSYPDGAVVPAQVSSVGPDRAEVRLHPDFPVDLARDQAPAAGQSPVDGDDDLTRLMSPGDVIAVEVAWVDGHCVVVLADEARASLAMPVLPGGPPWLLLDEPAPPALTPAESEPELPGQTPDPVAAPDALRHELADARAAAELYAEQVQQLELQLEAQRREARMLKADLRRARAERQNRTLPEVFANPEQQFRWEIDVAYLMQLDEAERAAYPLGEYLIGKAFVNRVDSLQGIPRSKILAVVVDVLCDRAKDIGAREVHPWRTGRTGPQETRWDGAKAWRVSLQVHSSSARRLKYWRLPDGRIELDTVAVHDEGIR